MRVEVLNTGSELLLGGALNSHLAFLGQQLFTVGLRIERQVCVGDGPAIGPVMQESFSRCDVLIVTGGLGPTSDDITRELIAEFFGLPLERDEEILAIIKDRFAKFGRPINENIARQASVPRGMTVLPNRHGTAPGLYLPAQMYEGKPRPHIFLLPGPPRELRPMVVAEVLDFPGVLSQGFDLADARLMIASALEDIAQMLLEEGKALPVPDPDATAADADLIELLPLSVEAGAPKH